MMDLQQYIQMGLMAAMAVSGWFLRMLWNATQELKTDLSKLREDMPHDYILKADYRSELKHIQDMLEKIYDKLEKKVDK
jgi:hypothetical protein